MSLLGAVDVAGDPEAAARQRVACRDPEAHIEHMRINGDCPWCPTVDTSRWAEVACEICDGPCKATDEICDTCARRIGREARAAREARR